MPRRPSPQVFPEAPPTPDRDVLLRTVFETQRECVKLLFPEGRLLDTSLRANDTAVWSVCARSDAFGSSGPSPSGKSS